MSQLTVKDHNRDVMGFKYIYPVISRRAGGLSIGINFNTNNACNWGCVYCQVPDLSIGTAPELDFELLASELREFLQDVLHGDFYDRFDVAVEQRIIKDIALSGNGEPTSVQGFSRAIALIIEIVQAAKIPEPFNYVLITNGSLIHKPDVQAGLRLFNESAGQVWYKIDSATEKGRAAINHTNMSNQRQQDNLRLSARLCATWVQSCVFHYAAAPEWGLLVESEQNAYVELLQSTQENLKGVMLYSVARPSLQPESAAVVSATEEPLQVFAKRIRALDLKVRVTL